MDFFHLQRDIFRVLSGGGGESSSYLYSRITDLKEAFFYFTKKPLLSIFYLSVLKIFSPERLKQS